MEYIGKLYGKFNGKYFETGKTSEDWDKLENDLLEKQDIIEQLTKALSKKNDEVVSLMKINKLEASIGSCVEEDSVLYLKTQEWEELIDTSEMSKSEIINLRKKQLDILLSDNLITKDKYDSIFQELYKNNPIKLYSEINNNEFCIIKIDTTHLYDKNPINLISKEYCIEIFTTINNTIYNYDIVVINGENKNIYTYLEFLELYKQ